MTEQEQTIYNIIKETKDKGIADMFIYEKSNFSYKETTKILFELEMEGLISNAKASYYDLDKGTIGVLKYTAYD